MLRPLVTSIAFVAFAVAMFWRAATAAPTSTSEWTRTDVDGCVERCDVADDPPDCAITCPEDADGE